MSPVNARVSARAGAGVAGGARLAGGAGGTGVAGGAGGTGVAGAVTRLVGVTDRTAGAPAETVAGRAPEQPAATVAAATQTITARGRTARRPPVGPRAANSLPQPRGYP
jgi:hypothetical protein